MIGVPCTSSVFAEVLDSMWLKLGGWVGAVNEELLSYFLVSSYGRSSGRVPFLGLI